MQNTNSNQENADNEAFIEYYFNTLFLLIIIKNLLYTKVSEYE